MKMSWMGLVLGLGLLMAISSDAVPLTLGHPDLCCFKFVTFKIPEANILKIEKTHPDCPKPGYVVELDVLSFKDESLKCCLSGEAFGAISGVYQTERETQSELQRPAEKMMSWMGLVLGLVLLISVSSDAAPEGPGHPVNCCFKFATFKIPESEILEIVKTGSRCPLPGYV
ncbi:hypothetical protein NFI96_026287 [Prochilodus magdalenae]|nr:hypothetical protein NFI96_026287 [Prochilodus magdalenae]